EPGPPEARDHYRDDPRWDVPRRGRRARRSGPEPPLHPVVSRCPRRRVRGGEQPQDGPRLPRRGGRPGGPHRRVDLHRSHRALDAMSQPTPWVCGNCRSINSDRADRCYSCRAPRALAVDLRSTAPPIRLNADTPPEKQAEVAKRGGATYANSSGRATVVEGAIYI